MARRLILLALALSLCSFIGMAQSKDYFRIARLSYLEGNVSFQHTDEVDWTAASINMALQPGDRIYTGDVGRAEIEFDDGSVVRLAEKTDVEILAMKEELIQLRVLIGLCSLTNRSDVDFEINTPAAAFTTTEKGSYRFDIAENGDADGIVRKGAMEVVNNRISRHVSSGEVLHVPAADNATEVLARYDQRDAWDEWTDRRNADENAVESRRYIADSVSYGVSDLDRYGRWVSVDAYGPAWVPTMGLSWSPYSDGRWCYRPYWGWTWVSYEPWGWLPYHYGRWYNSMSFGWCWIPGPSFGFNFWSPGLVRFYRGADWVSWAALGPGDYYNINNYYFNVHSRANVYYLNEMRLLQRRGPDDLINRNAPGAFRSVNTDQFVNGSVTGKTMTRAVQDPRQSARIVTDNLDVRPTSRSFSPAPERAVDRPNIKSRAVVVRTAPEVAARGDRFVTVTNPQVSVPRSRAAQTPAVGSRTQDTSGRNMAPARTYQVPQSRTVAPAPRPSYGQQGRDTPMLQGQRQENMQRSQQAPPSTTSRRMEPAPAAPRSSGSSSGGGFSSRSSSIGGYNAGGYSGGGNSSGAGMSSSSAGRTMSSSPAPAGGSDRGAATSRGTAAGSGATGASSSGGAVKKAPEPQVSSNYAPRSYQAPRATDQVSRASYQEPRTGYQAPRSYQAERSVAPQAQAQPMSRASVSRREVAGNTRSYAASPSARSFNNQSGSGAVRMSQSYSAPRGSVAQSSAPRSAPQRSSSSSGSQSSNRRVR